MVLQLDYDSTAYKTMHELSVEWPCLSFDIVPDHLGFLRNTYPQTMYLLCGSQAAEATANRLSLMKVSNITEAKHVDSDEEDEEEDEVADLPVVSGKFIKRRAATNRVRCMPQGGAYAASWSDDASVSIHHIAPLLQQLEDNANSVIDWKPVAHFAGHAVEGYGVAWSPVSEGHLITGDCNGIIHLWTPEMLDGIQRNWQVNAVPFTGHAGSVEDLVWSPTEDRVFASCSTDKTIKLWDARAASHAPVMSFEAHSDEVNVISWNPLVSHLLASGADDGVWKVHDLRKINETGGAEVFSFGFHKEPITSIEWCPFEDSMIAVASSDDSITIWDLSATHDDDVPEMALQDEFLQTIPEQLLFLHRGVFDPKELHWHKQIPGTIIATAANGLHIFAPENIVPK